MGARGWVARIASHWGIILSRGWLVTVEVPGYSRHPSSIQHDAVVNRRFNCTSKYADILVPTFDGSIEFEMLIIVFGIPLLTK